MKNFTVLLSFFFMTNLLIAQDVTWVGSSGNWNDANNWDCACIPDTTQRVEIDNATVTIPTAYLAKVKEVRIAENGVLVINGELEINAATGVGLIYNEGSIGNFGTILLTSTATSGLRNFNLLVNHGSILADSVAQTTLTCEGSPTQAAVFENHGLVDIVAFDSGFGLYSVGNSFIKNGLDGQINVRGGEPFGSAISIGDTLLNNGMIEVERGEIGGVTLINNHKINIHHKDGFHSDGLQVSTVDNGECGTISIKNVINTGLVFCDTLRNHGKIYIDSTGGDAMTNLINDYHINFGIIEIKRAGRFGYVYEQGSPVFRNEEGARFKISHCNKGGIAMFGTGVNLYNNGDLIIDSVGLLIGGATSRNGINAVSGSTIYNDSSGVMLLSNGTNHGIAKSSNFEFANYGQIEISNFDGHGIDNVGSEYFINYESGSILMEACQNGIRNAGGFFGNALFLNKGYVELDSMDIHCIDNRKTFINDTCGVIVLQSSFRNSSIFTNYGFVKSRGTKAHFLTGANGINHGVFEDLNDLTAASILKTSNAGIFLSPKSSSICIGSVIMDALDLGDASAYSVLGVYGDSQANTEVGSYDANTNETTINATVGSCLYYVIQHDGMQCQDTLKQSIIMSCPIVCPLGDHVWTGCASSNDWLDMDNWSRGSMPGNLDTVFIPANPAFPIFPELTMDAEIKALNLQLNANLIIKSGVTLDIIN